MLIDINDLMDEDDDDDNDNDGPRPISSSASGRLSAVPPTSSGDWSGGDEGIEPPPRGGQQFLKVPDLIHRLLVVVILEIEHKPKLRVTAEFIDVATAETLNPALWCPDVLSKDLMVYPPGHKVVGVIYPKISKAKKRTYYEFHQVKTHAEMEKAKEAFATNRRLKQEPPF